MRSRDIRYSIIGGRKRALTRWYVIKYRTSHTDQPKNRAYKGIEFNLDKETFVKWFQERDFEHASVDRIDKTKGYTMDNIQVIPLIGIVIDSDTETLLKKRNELLCKQNLYAETFKNHQCSEKPSFEEWLNW